MSKLHNTIFCLLGLIISVATVTSAAMGEEKFKAGDIAIVNTPNADLKAHGSVVAQLPRGMRFEVIGTSGDWVSGYALAEDASDKKGGWVNKAALTLLRRTTAEEPPVVPIKEPTSSGNAADNRPKVRPALERYNATVQYNDKGQPILCDISFSMAGNAALGFLDSMKTVRTLRMANTRITSDGLKTLRGLRDLEILDLAGTRIDNRTVTYLQSMKKLRTLNLAGTDVSDACIPFLVRLPALETLNLGGTLITDKALDGLAKMERLKSLHIICRNLTDPAIERLRRALPNTEIQR